MIEDETPFIQIVFEEVEEFGTPEHLQRLFNLMDRDWETLLLLPS